MRLQLIYAVATLDPAAYMYYLPWALCSKCMKTIVAIIDNTRVVVIYLPTQYVFSALRMQMVTCIGVDGLTELFTFYSPFIVHSVQGSGLRA